MIKIFSLVIAVVILSACATAKVAVSPDLKNRSHEYKITEKPLLTGDKIKFGPYLASKIDRSFTRGSGFTINSYKSERRHQTYSYDFNGKLSWKAVCEMSGKGQSVKIINKPRTSGTVDFGLETALNCSFNTTDQKASAFTLSFSGPRLVEITGSFNVSSDTYRVAVINRVEGSSFALGSPTGYAIYSGNNLIAAVDSINRKGPVWINKQLSDDSKDRVSLVIVALLLFQE